MFVKFYHPNNEFAESNPITAENLYKYLKENKKNLL